MSITPSTAALRCCRRALKLHSSNISASSSQCLRLASNYSPSTVKEQQRRKQHTTARRWQSTAAAATADANPKISGIVDQISQLTLLETADLVQSLKSRLNIPEMSFGAPSGGPATAAGPAPAIEEEEAAPATQEKTMFTLKLQSFDAAAKPKIIKEVKSMLGLSLVDSKKFVESAPKVLKEGVAKDECEKIIATLKALGGVVVME